jgi:hypothetical protein
MLRVIVSQDIELLTGAVEVAGEEEEFEEKEPGRAVGGGGFDLGNLGVDGFTEASILEQLVRGHGAAPEGREGKRESGDRMGLRPMAIPRQRLLDRDYSFLFALRS